MGISSSKSLKDGQKFKMVFSHNVFADAVNSSKLHKFAISNKVRSYIEKSANLFHKKPKHLPEHPELANVKMTIKQLRRTGDALVATGSIKVLGDQPIDEYDYKQLIEDPDNGLFEYPFDNAPKLKGVGKISLWPPTISFTD